MRWRLRSCLHVPLQCEESNKENSEAGDCIKRNKDRKETVLEILYPPLETHHEQTDCWFRHELDSHDGIFLSALGMRGCCESPAGMLFVCPCSTPDVSSPLWRWSPSTLPPPHSVFNHLCVSGSLWALILMPHSLTLQTLRCPSVSAESNLPPSTSSLIWRSSVHF